jgi:ATP-dependent Clp protease ATP-binding subunit ClpA
MTTERYFTPAAKAVIVEAQQLAQAFGHPEIGAQHVLMAIANVGYTAGSQALDAAGMPQSTMAAIFKHAYPSGPVPFTGQLQFSAEAKVVLTDSAANAAGSQHAFINTAHLVLAAADPELPLLQPLLGQRELALQAAVKPTLERWDAGYEAAGVPFVAWISDMRAASRTESTEPKKSFARFRKSK